MRIKKILCAFSFFLLLTDISHAELIFEETFFKNTTGIIDINRNISGLAGAALVVFSNGGILNPQTADMLGGGHIAINGDTVFGTLDFKILGSITKKIPLVNGTNRLFVSLKGKTGGKLTIQVFQGEDQPTVTFPPGTIFVSPLGTDTSSCGIKPLPSNNPSDTSGPCLSISFGLYRAVQTTAPQVAVGLGIYIENITLSNGISLMGGYDPEFSKRDLVSLRSIIKGDGLLPATISAINLSTNALFEGFIVEGPSVTSITPTANSIGISIVNSSAALVVRNNIIFAGVSADGERGLTGTNGQNGSAGGNGQGGRSYTNSNPTVINGGSGGASSTAAGGRGGDSNAPVYLEKQPSGANGTGTGAGAGGAGGYNWKWHTSCSLIETGGTSLLGLNGGNGFQGSTGVSGIGGNSGSVLPTGIWVSQAGGNGANGTNGKGGGGGGAAGGVDQNTCPGGLVGSSGGGGGAGGEYGWGAAGGQGGGSAFGIFIYNSDPSQKPDVVSNQIHLGIAGNGGDGGIGGRGGTGGQGGSGGSAMYFNLQSGAGNGGRGGDGGHGGGGGGGAGGNSVGIFANFIGSYENYNTIDISTGRSGLGGIGGLSLGYLGQNGSDGEVLTTLYPQ